MATKPKLVREDQLCYSTEHNDALRYALYESWKQRCHHCNKWLKGARETQIDHLLPRDLNKYPRKKKKVLKYLGLPKRFDLNSVENLAPIHPDCNGPDGKGATKKRSGYLYERIEKSHRRAPAIRKIAAGLLNSRGLQQAIATVDSYEHFKTNGATTTYTESARVMLQAFQDQVPHLFDSIIVEKHNFSFPLEEVMSEIVVPTDVGVGIGLTASDQSILRLVESVSGVTTEDLMERVLRRTLEATRSAAEQAAADYVDSYSSPGNAVFSRYNIEISEISHSGNCSDPVEIRVHAEGNASVFVAPNLSPHHIQKDVEIQTTLDVQVTFPENIGADVEIDALADKVSAEVY